MCRKYNSISVIMPKSFYGEMDLNFSQIIWLNYKVNCWLMRMWGYTINIMSTTSLSGNILAVMSHMIIGYNIYLLRSNIMRRIVSHSSEVSGLVTPFVTFFISKRDTFWVSFFHISFFLIGPILYTKAYSKYKILLNTRCLWWCWQAQWQFRSLPITRILQRSTISSSTYSLHSRVWENRVSRHARPQTNSNTSF